METFLSCGLSQLWEIVLRQVAINIVQQLCVIKRVVCGGKQFDDGGSWGPTVAQLALNNFTLGISRTRSPAISTLLYCYIRRLRTAAVAECRVGGTI